MKDDSSVFILFILPSSSPPLLFILLYYALYLPRPSPPSPPLCPTCRDTSQSRMLYAAAARARPPSTSRRAIASAPAWHVCECVCV